MGDAEIDHLRVPATNSCSSCTNPPCLIPWWFMIFPTNLSTFSRAELYRGSPPHTCRNFVQPYGFLRTSAPFRSLTFLPTGPLSLPTWVLGVTLRKEALKPCRNSLFTTFITDSTVSILSLNFLIFEPPGYKRWISHP